MNDTPSVSGAQKAATNVEDIVNSILPLDAALGGTTGAAINAGVTLAEKVTNAILVSTATHAAPLAIAEGAVNAVAANAAPVIATLSPADQTRANAALDLWQSAVAEVKAVWGDIEGLL